MDSDLDTYRRSRDSTTLENIESSNKSYEVMSVSKDNSEVSDRISGIVNLAQIVMPCFSHMKDRPHHNIISFRNGAKKGAQITVTLPDKIVYVRSEEYFSDAQKLAQKLGYRIIRSYIFASKPTPLEKKASQYPSFLY